MNPSLDERVVQRAMQNDRAAAMAEYGAEFRSDICNFVDRDIIEANVMSGVRALMPSNATTYRAFCDPSGGSSDSFTLAIAHYDGKKETCIIDAIREIVPPFSPEAAVAELSQLMKSFHVTRVVGDRYAGLWPTEGFSRHGITYEPSAMTKSELYGALLPLLNSGRIELVDHAKLVTQLASLERRTGRGSRDSIDHPTGQHDDCANCVAGAAAITVAQSGYNFEVWRKAFGDSTEDEPPPPRHVPADGSSVPFIPWDLRMQHERAEAAARGTVPAPLPIHPSPEMIREVFRKLEAERGGRV
jgi:hypothetical protein